MTDPKAKAQEIRHKWENNTCLHCGLERQMRNWKLCMAIVGSKDYYQYGRQYAYSYDGFDHWSWNRPNCNKNIKYENIN